MKCENKNQSQHREYGGIKSETRIDFILEKGMFDGAEYDRREEARDC